MATKNIYKKSALLRKIGLWATVWWGVSCVYILVLIVSGLDNYASISASGQSEGFFSDRWSAISSAYSDSTVLPVLLGLIIIVWLVGGCIWLRELKHRKVSYKAAFKDLFLTLR